MRKPTCLILALLCYAFSFAQSVTVKGTVTDTAEHKPLVNAAVVLLSKDSIILKHARTDAQGHFELAAPVKEGASILISFPKFADYADVLKSGEPVLDLGSLKMIRKSALLEEVIVSQKIGAIRMKGDTLEFKADSFAVRPGATVDEMLKRLPGLQVNSKGEITAQGEKVQKVLVDGEEFFSDDPAVVTQNLRADAIDKVQVYDKKSDQATFTGIDDGEKQKTINLQMKDDKKKGYFGKAKLGGGLPGYFENEAMFNLFKGRRKMSAYGTMSNTGKAGLDWGDADRFGGGNDMEFDEENGYWFSYGDGDDMNTWGGRYNGEGLPKAWTAGAHFSNKWDTDKKNVNGNYQFYKQDIENNSTSASQYILPDTLYYNNQRASSSSQNLLQKLSGYYDLKLDSSASVKIKVNGSKGNAKNESFFNAESLSEERLPVNNQLRSIASQGDRQKYMIDAIWRKKFAKKGRTMSLTANSSYTDNNTNGQVYSITNYFDVTGNITHTDTIDQRKLHYQQSNGFAGKISYTEPLSKKWFLELNYGYVMSNSKAYRTSFNPNASGKYDQYDSLYSNNFSFDYGTHSGGVNFRFNGDKITASFGSNIANARFKQNDLLHDSLYSYNFTNLFPKASIRFKMGAQTGLNIRYNGSTTQPSVQQLQPIRDNTDNLNISFGNPNLRQQFTHNINIFFNDYKVISGRNLYMSGNISQSDNAISGYDAVDANGKRTYTYVNIDGNLNYNVYGGIWKQFKKAKLNSFANLQFNGGRVNNYINTLRNTNKYYTVGTNFGLMKDKENKYNVELNISPSYTWSRTSLRPDVVTKYWTIDYAANARYQFKWKIELQTDLRYNWRQATDVFGQNRNVFIWNAWIGKKFWKNNNGELRFSINDILNQNIGFQRNASSNFISERTYSTLKRYWLVSFAWNFNKTPGSK